MKASRPHQEAIVKMLREDPASAEEYLRAAIGQMDQPRGKAALFIALRHLAEARGGMAKVAKAAGLSRGSLYRALSSRGNPSVKTLFALLGAMGFKMTISHSQAAAGHVQLVTQTATPEFISSNSGGLFRKRSGAYE